MKRFPFVLFLLVSNKFILAQNVIPNDKNRLELKAKNYKTASLVTGGIGIACIATSAVLSVSELEVLGDDGVTTPKQRTAGVLAAVGFINVLAGFGFHLASKSVKRKAKVLSFGNKQTHSLQNGKLISQAIPTLSLKFVINR